MDRDSFSIAVVTPIEPMNVPDSSLDVPGARWQPVVGEETLAVIEKRGMTGTAAGSAVIESAKAILARGVDPREERDVRRTGLVVGYVQSGKTFSFTTVVALARDNGYPLVIIVTGTSTSLLNQSTERLRTDLSIGKSGSYLKWRIFKNPTDTDQNARNIANVLDDWKDVSMPSYGKATVLITVMKNYQHLNNLTKLLNRLRAQLQGHPVLIVDDEGDQASLNILVKQKRRSTIYRRVLELRDVVFSHTFLQYTATPQAPLLINISDSLSPDFVEVLEPGDEYVGGKLFFGEAVGQKHELVKIIPYDDVPTDDSAFDSPPESLLEAMRIFIVGTAAGLKQELEEGSNGTADGHRSMLVHPAREIEQHHEYHSWISQVISSWQRLISLPELDPDRIEFVEELHDAYRDLQTTVPSLPEFDKLIEMLPRTFRAITIEEVNTGQGQTPTIDWSQSYGWILVGGQAMDRGFTVEGLTVTYMPRRPGVGNADTIQQRGRFFGYKLDYLGYCRTYLERRVLEAFREYVHHEEDMRRQLRDVRDTGKPLSEWKRKFVLSPDLQPCRNDVVQYGYARGDFAEKWFAPRFVLNTTSVLSHNREIVQSFLSDRVFDADEGHPNRELAQQHIVSRSERLVEVIERLLLPFQFGDALTDEENISGLLLQLSYALDQNRNEQCTVYRMSPEYKRSRKVDTHGRIRNLFQGESLERRSEVRGSIYPGDREIHDLQNVTVQLHFVDLRQGNERVAEDVAIVAVRVPRRMGLSWIAQEQP